MTTGYITYTEDSVLTPTVTVGDITVDEQVLTYVRDNYEAYRQYKGYILQGPYDTHVNRAMRLLFTPRREPITTGMYVTFLGDEVPIPPVAYTIPIVRNVYLLRHIEGSTYQQVDMVGNDTEEYQVGTMDDRPVYIGTNGTFILSDAPLNP